ncbi:hypothetical protein SB6413_05382 [Klebsiella pasteurii]|nr:hypothetical protein SB6413_05382 [Klebsiella pasteurii]
MLALINLQGMSSSLTNSMSHGPYFQSLLRWLTILTISV